MAAKMKTYTVEYERDESGWWVASVKGVRGCHTQGRTIDEARRRIREALSLFVKDAGRAKLVDDVRLPAGVRRKMKVLSSIRRAVDVRQAKAQVLARKAVDDLTKGMGLSLRDAGRLLGLSHQRVQQLARG